MAEKVKKMPGLKATFKAGKQEGHKIGYEEGLQAGEKIGFKEGEKEGRKVSRKATYSIAYKKGKADTRMVMISAIEQKMAEAAGFRDRVIWSREGTIPAWWIAALMTFEDELALLNGRGDKVQ